MWVQILLQLKGELWTARSLQVIVSTWPHRILAEVGCLNEEDAENLQTLSSGSREPVK